MKYKVVETNDRWKLAEEVNSLLKEGWSCQGGVAIHKSGFYDFYSQAMVKE